MKNIIRSLINLIVILAGIAMLACLYSWNLLVKMELQG